MSLFKQSNRKRAEVQRQRRLGTKRQTAVSRNLTRTGVTSFFLHLAFGLLAVIICFLGLSSAGPLVQENQMSRVRIMAEIPFEYTSRIETEQRMRSVQRKVPPIFRLDLEPFRQFRDYGERLTADLLELGQTVEGESVRMTKEEVDRFLRQYAAGNPFNLRPVDVATLYNELGKERLAEVVSEGLIILGEIYRRGVFSEEDGLPLDATGDLTLFRVEDERGNIREVDILSMEEGLRALRIQLSALDIPREARLALLRILRAGLHPNLIFDEELTNERVEAVQANVQPVRVEVEEGESIIEPNSRVSALDFEQLQAYRRALREEGSSDFGINTLFIERAVLSILILIGSVFFLKVSRNPIQHDPRLLALSGALVLVNLLLVRLVIELGDSVLAEATPMVVQLVPYLTPLILGPVLITILVGTGPGLLAAGLIAIFNAMMQNNSLSILLISQVSCIAAIYYCRNIQLRASLVRAGLISGLVMSLGALIQSFYHKLELTTVAMQMLASLGNGLLCGILVVGLLPVLEQVFRYTTDITLLELTDYNHPLLRKMQVQAPGSYHHSLMVANLSENAAAAVGANTLVCRVCALFHDIGKIVKPDYFAENQREGINPHLERNPSMSALVIKRHVKEGIQLAREYRLPQVIREVIRQHHGTSLIQYFYYKAIEQQREEGVIESIYPNAPRIELSQVNEDTYRYEGPVPQTAESAIIMLADSVEAASRSLRKVTPQSVEELVGKIFLGRLQDGQLDEASLTFRELKKIRESFTFTLLNMLHARVEYPDAPKEEGSGNGNGKRKRGNRGDGERNGESTDETEKEGGEEAGGGEASGKSPGTADS